MIIRISMRNLVCISSSLLLNAIFGPGILSPQNLFAQTERGPVETDRDSFTRSPRLVETKDWVIEGSYSFLDQKAEHEGHLFPDLLVRYGVSEDLEMRLGWTYEIGKFHQLVPAGSERFEEGILNYGAKFNLTDADAWLPASALILTGYTPTSGPSSDSDLSVEYAGGWTLENEWEFDTGLRWFMLTEEEDHFSELAPSVVLKVPFLEDRVNVHFEYFCLLSRGREENYRQHYLGPGAHYLITPNMEIGTRLFWGVSEDAAAFVCNVGTGIRF
jgi:hypothetical protein